MNLPQEIQEAAEELGRLLSQSPQVVAYLKAVEAISKDAVTVYLEEEFTSLQQSLASREKAGHVLQQSDLIDYYQLQEQINQNPLIAARDEHLQTVKSHCAEAGCGMAAVLGIDFSVLAL